MYYVEIFLFGLLLDVICSETVEIDAKDAWDLFDGPTMENIMYSKLPQQHLDCKTVETPVDDVGVYSPIVSCEFLPDEFINCINVRDMSVNTTEREDKGLGCDRYGAAMYQDVLRTDVPCHALRCIECKGPRYFYRRSKPCIKYNGHYFLTTLLYSIFLGMFAVDRFCLGYTGIAVGKFMTLGGVGVWWIVDIFLLVTGSLTPADDSSWEPYY